MVMIRIVEATKCGDLAGQHSPVARLNGFVWAPYQQPCWHCEKPTSWIDIDFECHLCPGQCSEKKWDEYAWAEMMAKWKEMRNDQP